MSIFSLSQFSSGSSSSAATLPSSFTAAADQIYGSRGALQSMLDSVKKYPLAGALESFSAGDLHSRFAATTDQIYGSRGGAPQSLLDSVRQYSIPATLQSPSIWRSNSSVKERPASPGHWLKPRASVEMSSSFSLEFLDPL